MTQAQRRCGGLSNVEVVQGALPEHWPPGRFDLVVLSEVGYFLDRAGFDAVLDAVQASALPNAHVLAVHFRPPAEEHLRTGDDVHAQFVRRRWIRLAQHVGDALLLDVFQIG